MPLHIDPAWEYWEPDPEVAELFAMTGACEPRARIADHRADSKGDNVGFRFGSGNPNWARLHLAPERQRAARPVLAIRPCPTCGYYFRPHRTRCRYCCIACTPHAGAPRSLPDRICSECDIVFRPRSATSVYCSVACSAIHRRAAIPDRFVSAWAAGVTVQELMDMFGMSRSGIKKWRRVAGLPSREGVVRQKVLAPLVCPCGVTFQPKRTVTRFCSRRCGRVHRDTFDGRPRRC